MAYCEEVIITDEVRGKGTIDSPVRRVTMVYKKDGELIATHDPHPETYTLFDLIRFHRWATENISDDVEVSPSHVQTWLRNIE